MPPITSYVAFDRIPVAALILEIDGTVVAANGPAGRLFAIPAGQLIGVQLAGLVDSDGALARLLDSSRHSGETVHELHFESLHGRRTIECVISALLADGRPVYQLFAIDVTARKQAEAEARARADAQAEMSAQQRMESLGIIAGGIAHDFNNLLVGVLAEASATREDPDLGDGAREAMRRIETSAHRMAHLTRQMLAYAGRGRFVMQQLAADRQLEDTAELLVRTVGPGVRVELRPGARKAVVEADAALLRQVIANLVLNASEAGARFVVLATRTLFVKTETWWQLDVIDDGAGIERDVIGRVFEPFFSTNRESHGLGLSAVHGIVRRFGGHIDVESTPGKGSRFAVRLPVVAGADVPGPRSESLAAPIAAKLAGVRVLVADDEPTVRSTVRRLLERRGASVVLASDGAEAEEKLRHGAFGLVICDVVMPGRGGYDVLATARALDPRCPFLIMSGYTERVRGDEEPDAFLEKPFTARVLDEAIDGVMQSRQPEP